VTGDLSGREPRAAPGEASLRDFLDNGGGWDATGLAPAADPRPARFHRSMPGYSPSPVADAPGVASHLGLARLAVKMEVERFGLPSFKILGASWAVCRALSARAGLAEPVATFGELRAIAASGSDLVLVAATDGNHGRAVASMARRLRLGARILVPAGTAAARIDAIVGEGAEVEVVDGTYDDAVALSATAASERRLVISDTSWPGYEEVPRWVADGYTTIFSELAEQLPDVPELVAVQIGVGALASAAVRALAAPGRALVGVEPGDAACALAAVRAGAPVLVAGPHRSVMVGLSCGLVSQIALPDMARGMRAFCAIDDRAVETAVRLLLSDGLECGETGASGVAGLLALHERRRAGTWERLGLGARTSALAICTEAPTDPASFARITRTAG
jgi:diaminopropionate ammonia-lyase